MMKKIIIIATAAFSLMSYAAEAQTTDELAASVKDAPARQEVISNKFDEVRTAADGKVVSLSGDLVYKPESYLSMAYSNGELFLIDGNSMTINRDGKNQVFDLTKNIMMKNLSHVLLYSFGGALKKLSEEQKTLINAEVKGGEIVITLQATKPSARGYKKIEVFYDAVSKRIKAMTMDEFTGASTHYSM